MDETFLLTNIAPQVGDGFNRHCKRFRRYNACCKLTSSSYKDWAFVEDFCRRLTSSFSDVYVFTVPLYLPRREADGKWRVVSHSDFIALSSTENQLVMYADVRSYRRTERCCACCCRAYPLCVSAFIASQQVLPHCANAPHSWLQ